MHRRRIKRAIVLVAAIGAFPLAAPGASTSWTFNGSGSWTVASNWNNGVPVSNSDVFIRHNDALGRLITYDYAGASIQFNSMTVENSGASGADLFLQTANTFNAITETAGNTGTGLWELNGGTHNITSGSSAGLAFGSLAGGTGIGLLLTGTLNASSAQVFVGFHGAGTFTQSGGLLSAAYLTIASQSDGTGTYSLTAGNATINTGLYVGFNGNGTMNVSGGNLTAPSEYIGSSGTGLLNQTGGVNTLSNSGTLFIGSSASGTYLLSSNGVLTVSAAEVVGLGTQGHGTFDQSGGTQTIGTSVAPGTLDIAQSSGSTGSYSFSGGSLTVTGEEVVGDAGTATFNQTGGVHTLAFNSFSGGSMFIGNSPGAAGTYLLSNAGSLNTGALTVGDEFVGVSGSGTLNQSGGAQTIRGELEVGSFNGSVGNYILSAGTLSMPGEFAFIGVLGAGTFNQSGGVNNPADLILGSSTLSASVFGRGTYQLSGSGSLTAFHELIGQSGVGSFIQTGGTNTVGIPGSALGSLSISHGQYTLSDAGILNVNGAEIIGATSGTLATFQQDGGAHNVGLAGAAGTLQIQGFGRLNLNGGVLTVLANESIGGGTPPGGIVNQEGGSHVIGTPTVPGQLQLGNGAVYFLGGGALTLDGLEAIGEGGPASFNQFGGVHTVGTTTNSNFYLGYHFPSTYQLSGGALTVSGTEAIGVLAGGTSTFTQTGGTNVITGPLGVGALEISAFSDPSVVGVYQLDDGSLTVNGFVDVGGVFAGPTGNGLLNIQGGSMSVSGTLNVWDSASTAVNLIGGALAMDTLDTDHNPSRFNWTAGTLTITGNSGLTIGNTGPLGLSVSLNSLQTLAVNKATVINSPGQITLNGGTFSTATITGSGHLIINTGTFQLTNSDIAIGPGSPLPTSLELNTGANIVVSGPGHGFFVPSYGFLQLNGGAVFVTGSSAYFANLGQTVLSSPLSLISGVQIFNEGLLSGTGRINATLINGPGTVSVGANDTLIFGAAGNSNTDRFALGGGTIQFTANLTNSGTISGAGSLFVGTLTNNGTISALTTLSVGSFSNAGTVQLSGGQTNVFGPVSNTGRIVITGGSTTTFFGDVNTSTGSISVGTNTTAVFFGNVTGQSHFFGAGIKDFEGAVSGGPIASIVGDTYVGTPANVTTQFFNEDDLSISGIAAVAPNGTSAAVSRVHTLSFFDNGKLDLNDDDLIIDYTGASPLATILSDIKTGYANGAWNGNQITSSSAHAAALTSHPTALGYAEASALGLSSFDGQSVDNSTIVIRYTFSGDANLDGVVNTQDFTALAADFGSTGQIWDAGDFNYDGVVNALDFNALATNYGQVLSSPAVGTLVPEPASLSLVALCASLGAVRTRRRRI